MATLAETLNKKLTADDLRDLAAAVAYEADGIAKDILAVEIVDSIRRLVAASVDYAEHLDSHDESAATVSYPAAPKIELVDIRWRIDSKPTNINGSAGRARYVSYIDARTTADYLDRWVGSDGWEERYEEATFLGEAVVWCHLSLHFPTRTIVHSDLTTYRKGRGETTADQTATGIKGAVSDSFKRAAAKAGVGRNVYELPEVWAPCRVSANGKAYPADNVADYIAHELARVGHTVADVAVDDRVDDEAPEPEAVEEPPPNWTRDAKIEIYNNLGEDKAAAARFYTAAIAKTGIPEPIPDQDSARRIVAAATTLALADGVALTVAETDRAVETAVAVVADLPLSEPIPDGVDPDVYAWIHEGASGPNDETWAYTFGAKRATLHTTVGDLASAKAIWATMTEDYPKPLSRELYHAHVEALSAP